MSLPENNLEVVPFEVSGPQLVAVSRRVQHTDTRRVDRIDAIFAPCGYGNELPRDRTSILQSGCPNVVAAQTQGLGNVLDEVVGGDVLLLDPQKEVFSFTGWFVGGDFFDEKVFRLALQSAANAEKVGSEERRPFG
jgi:hypothetical protein